MKKAHDVTQFSEGAIRCRSFGHSWKPYTAKPWDKRKVQGYNVTLICDNGCDTFKHFTLSSRGEYGSPKYSYGDMYLATFTVDQADKASMRLETLRDIL